MANVPQTHPPTAPGREIKKRKNLTYAEKWEIVKLINGGQTKLSAAKKYNINESTIRDIYKNREHIKKHIETTPPQVASQALRSRNQLLLKTEQLLLERYLNQQAKRNVTVDTREVTKWSK
ncbi:hypothetical protein Pcinc_031663 [Petrolisthes cinctipes]|uniref:HTH psq-type domain-containing protein n=1 Tax=Petrolisthes cinctipes TaxID=88211 RepID=A0AAE1K487_PETCI|nr:hypothetical protein Pcinc_031663 [Petrolisthes cinctipes]